MDHAPPEGPTTPGPAAAPSASRVLSRRSLLKTTTAAGIGAAGLGSLAATPAGAATPAAAVTRAPATLGAPTATAQGVAATTSQFRSVADAGMAVLQSYYSPGNGQWNTAGWWNAANILTTVIEYTQRTGSPLYTGDIPQTFAAAELSNLGFIDGSYDDNLWWAQAWIRAYDLTGNPQYLNMAKFIFGFCTSGWIDICGGGIVWQITNWYKETIANELFLSVAAALHLRSPGDGGPGSYLDWANREWAWFQASGLINAQSLVNDGLDSNCANNGETTWTYNQGVILGGLASMHQITGDPSYLQVAEGIAKAVMATLSVNGILNEPYTPGDNASNPVTDPNVVQFKGIFIRNLYQLYQQDPQPAYRQFILANAQSVCDNNLSATNQFGYLWQGPSNAFLTPYLASVQSSALDAVHAAIGVVSGPVQPLRPLPPPNPPGLNLVTNPSGSDGTTGWSPAYNSQDATLAATTYLGGPALQWTVNGIGHEDWVSYYPAVENGRTYTFTVGVAGWGQVVLEVWNGTADILSLPVNLLPWFQTLTWTVTIPANAPTGQSGSAPQLQIATLGLAPVSVYLRRASVVGVNVNT